MSEEGASRRGHVAIALVGVAAAAILALSIFGFTVDDALIVGRYAHHLASGTGYRMNAGGPITDGVTPLGFAYLIAPFASGGAEAGLAAAKWIGLVAHLLGVAAVATTVARRGGPFTVWAGPTAWVVAAPAAAWAGAGLETGFVSGLVAVGLSLRVARRADALGIAFLAAAAGLRPELLPLALVLCGPSTLEGAARPPTEPRSEAFDASGDDVQPGIPATLGTSPGWGTALRLGAALTPFLLVALLRASLFGVAAPLSSIAKRPDPTLGLSYAAASALLAGFVGLVAPRALARADRYARFVWLAALVHLAAIAFAGGDWMPLSRLVVPALPVLALAVAELARVASPRWVLLRLGLALAGEIFVWWTQGPKLDRVGRERAALIAEVAPQLEGARVIAALDVGWLGAAAPAASIVDLAGVTDPEVARLPGSHTNKRLPEGFLEERRVELLLLQVPVDVPVAEPWTATPFVRGVERRLAAEPGAAERFQPVARTGGRAQYLLLRRVTDAAAGARSRGWQGSEL